MPKPGRPKKTLEFTPTKRRKALIDWNDPSKQAHVLDWRHRAQEFGLAVDTHEDVEDAGQPFAPNAEQILHEEEPEAFDDQPVRAEAEEEEQVETGVQAGREEVDLVRVYLQHIGKRKLLKAADERTIGERIENAQRDLVTTLGDVPSAVQTLLSLADRIRTKGDPAAELILLPEGGELKEEHVTPVLKAFARVKRRRCIIDDAKEKLANPRLGVKAKAQIESQIARTRNAMADDLAAQPIRPSLIDDIVAELTHLDEEFRAAEQLPREQRTTQCTIGSSADTTSKP